MFRVNKVKTFLRQSLPRPYSLAAAVRGRVRRTVYRLTHRDHECIPFYKEEGWFGGKGSGAGVGSDFVETEVIRREIPTLIRDLRIRSILDAPCGDFYWMRAVKMDVEKYTGIDIAEDFIENNTRRYGNSRRVFMVKDIRTEELPQADLVLCRDFLVHMSDKDAMQCIRQFKGSKSKYLLATTHTATMRNEYIETGQWRPMNLQLAPFRFPDPIKLIREEAGYQDVRRSKSLGLWRLADIQL